MTPPHPHAAEFRRCLVELDVAAARRLHREDLPDNPQFKDDAQVLHMLHLVRVRMPNLPIELRRYSQAWLDERERRSVAYAVGVAVGAPAERQDMADDLAEAMSSSVMNSYTAGIDLNEDAPEVKRRMDFARERLIRFRKAIRGFRFPGGNAD